MAFSDKFPISFDVVACDEAVITEVVNLYNKKYNTHFEITSFEDRDGVLFASIDLCKGVFADIFQLGYFFGVDIQAKRASGETDM